MEETYYSYNQEHKIFIYDPQIIVDEKASNAIVWITYMIIMSNMVCSIFFLYNQIMKNEINELNINVSIFICMMVVLVCLMYKSGCIGYFVTSLINWGLFILSIQNQSLGCFIFKLLKLDY